METSPKHTLPLESLAATLILAGIGLAVILFVLSAGNARNHESRRRSLPPPAGGKTRGSLRRICGKPIGAAGAPVTVEAFLPVSIGCQDPIGLYLARCARDNPRAIRFQLYDMKDAAARRRMAKFGVHCAAVVINGSTRFDLGKHGGRLLLEGPMELEDVKKALAWSLQQVRTGSTEKKTEE